MLIGYSTKQTRRIKLPDTPFQWITFFSTPADKGRAVMIEYNERAAVSRLLIPSIIDGWRVTNPDLDRVWGNAIEALSAGDCSALDTAEELLMKLPETMALGSLKVDYPGAFAELERQFPALLTAEDRWPLRLRDRALHHLGEIRRVSSAALVLESLHEKSKSSSTIPTMRSIGLLLNESHNSLRDLYDVSTDEVERLVEIIHSDKNVFGVRLMGGGFGGNVLALTTQDNSSGLIDRVQTEYYKPQQRNGVQEGSVMISTPGDGLSQIDFNSLWRKVINRVNSLGRSATLCSSKILTLLDALPLDLNADDIWPVIVAAGRGTRATASGLEVAKPVALVRNKPAITRVLENIHLGLGKTRPPIIIVSPETEATVRQALGDQEVRFVLQPEPRGTGDAVLYARELMASFTGMALVVWSTQPVIRPKTFERIVKLARLFNQFEMVIPTTLRDRPYAPLQRDEFGRIRSAQETHLEGAEVLEFGETNIGLFVLKNRTMFEVLTDLRSRYWDEKTNRYGRANGELGFPNELVKALAQRENGVFACPIADSREEQGIKMLADVARCERFIDELELDQTS